MTIASISFVSFDLFVFFDLLVLFDLFVFFVLMKLIAHAERLDRVSEIGRGLRSIETTIF